MVAATVIFSFRNSSKLNTVLVVQVIVPDKYAVVNFAVNIIV